MTCQDVEQYIPLFIEDKLTGFDLQEFIMHIEGCHSCYEEMETNYLLKEALLRLEDGDAFDLHSELLQKLDNMRRCVSLHERVSIVRRTILIAAGLALIAQLLYLYLR